LKTRANSKRDAGEGQRGLENPFALDRREPVLMHTCVFMHLTLLQLEDRPVCSATQTPLLGAPQTITVTPYLYPYGTMQQ
jgi:hypothetical protein